MTAYIIRRLLYAIPVLFCIILVTFVLARSLPGGPFDRAGDKTLPESIRKNLEAKYGLDDPMYVQFTRYLGNVLQGDLGPSYSYRGRSVNQIMKEAFPISLQLGILSILLALAIGVPAGIIAALRHNSWVDYSSSFVAILGVSIPNIVLGPVLIYVFAVLLGWLPAARWGENYKAFYLGWIPPMSADFWRHAILPTITLGTAFSATFARLTRATLLQTIREDYIRTARSKGLSQYRVVMGHALKNSLIPVVTVFGPMLIGVVTGSFVVERIFGIPGMGEFFVTSVTNRDYPIILGTTLIYSAGLVMANLGVDVAYAWLDPRIRYD
ncbi:MAG: ABC transporter permease [Caldilineaceae bacterium]|nr:ABC transporter permease [Caldilineaceae bacterium]